MKETPVQFQFFWVKEFVLCVAESGSKWIIVYKFIYFRYNKIRISLKNIKCTGNIHLFCYNRLPENIFYVPIPIQTRKRSSHATAHTIGTSNTFDARFVPTPRHPQEILTSQCEIVQLYNKKTPSKPLVTRYPVSCLCSLFWL